MATKTQSAAGDFADEFDGVENVSGGSRLPRFTDGDYIVEVVENRRQQGQKNKKEVWYIDSFRILEATGPQATKAGSMVATSREKGWDTHLKTTKQLVAALTNKADTSITKEHCAALYGEEQFARGFKLRVTVFQQPKVKSEGMKQVIRYSPYTAPTPTA
jgi:hypothetical protein